MYTPFTTQDETVYLSTPLAKGMYDAILLSYQAKIKYAKTNLHVYFSNPAGIGEHSDVLAEIDVHLATIADAEGKLMALEQHFAKAPETTNVALGNTPSVNS